MNISKNLYSADVNSRGLHFKLSTYASEYPSPVTSAVVMDAHGTVLYSLNQDARVYPASTTKIMTILLALENKKSR